MKIIGRKEELAKMTAVLKCERHFLVEGPVGVGKTYLLLHALKKIKKKSYRVDGDSRYNEQKLTGWFDPPFVLKKGYLREGFIAGPLVQAMQEGAVLFINELNRMPESVQNILLPAMDEKFIEIPQLGRVEAQKGFSVVATQNPREFTATHSLSEALLDRFEMLSLHYQSEEEERLIVEQAVGGMKKQVSEVVRWVRATREHHLVKRGASIRAGIAMAELVKQGLSLQEAAPLAFSTRIELIDSQQNLDAILLEIEGGVFEKKKSNL